MKRSSSPTQSICCRASFRPSTNRLPTPPRFPITWSLRSRDGPSPWLWRGTVGAYCSAGIHNNWESSDPGDRAMALGVQTYLPGDLLVLGDRMSMAHSLEVRVPFCDHVVAQFALGLSAHDRFRNGRLKSFLKKTLAPFLPVEILTRSKQGFKVPLARWFNADLQEMVS